MAILLILQLFFLVPQRIDGQFNIPATAAVIDPNCVDKIPSCWNLPDDNCKAPYEDWAREYCGNRCGYCRGLPTPAPACEDNLPNCADYDISVCSDTNYRSWANLNCRFFCRHEFCSAEQIRASESRITTIAPEDCFNKVDCRQYDMSVCGDQYKLWARDNCPLHCGICTGVTTPPPPCVDTIPNCKDYPSSTCSEPNFKLWVEDNCRKYCGICSPQSASPPPPGKRNQEGENLARDRRQFQASHHHQGSSNDCWDSNAQNCSPMPTSEVLSTAPPLEIASEFPGSEFKPHPKPDPNWDSKPSTTAAPSTPKPKPPTESPIVSSSTSTSTEVSSQPTDSVVSSPTSPSTQIQTTANVQVSPEVSSSSNTVSFSPSTDPSSTAIELDTTTTSSATPRPSVTASTKNSSSPTIHKQSITTQTPSLSTDSTITSSIEVSSTSSTSSTTDSTISSSTPQHVTQPSSTAIELDTTTTGSATPQPSITASSKNYSSSTTPKQSIITQTTPLITEFTITNTITESSTSTIPLITNTSSEPSPVTSSTTNSTLPTVSFTQSTQTTSTPPSKLTLATTTQNSTAVSSTSAPCEDKRDNCIFLGRSACTNDAYVAFMRKNCAKFCGFCIDTNSVVECKDANPLCAQYDNGDLCTDPQYDAWNLENCMLYCKVYPCNAPCEDKRDNCATYGRSACTDAAYVPFLRKNCAKFCGFCVSPNSVVECKDANPLCAQYDSGDLCTDSQYDAWNLENCMLYCKVYPCNGTITTPSTL